MNKRLIAGVLALLIVIGTLPNTVLAADGSTENSEIHVTEKAVCPVEPEVAVTDAMTEDVQLEMESGTDLPVTGGVATEAPEEPNPTSGSQAEGPSEGYDYISGDTKWKTELPALKNNEKENGITYTVDVLNTDVTTSKLKITYIIPETCEASELNLNIRDAFYQGINQTHASFPLGKAEIQIEIQNKSKHDYAYKKNSFYASSDKWSDYTELAKSALIGFDGQHIPIAFFAGRTTNEVFQSLYSSDKLTASSYLDENLIPALAAKGYTRGIDDLSHYYLDYYNRKNQTSYKKLEDMPIDKNGDYYLEWSNRNHASQAETSMELQEFYYNFWYNAIVSFADVPIDGNSTDFSYSIGEHMRAHKRGESLLDNSINKVWDSISSGESALWEGTKLQFSGKYYNNPYAGYSYGLTFGFTLNRTDFEPITFTVTGGSYEYDGTPHTVTLSGLDNSFSVRYSTDNQLWSDTPPVVKHVSDGKKTVYVKVNKAGYAETIKNADIEVVKRPIQIMWPKTTKFTYDGSEKNVTPTIHNLIAGDDVSLTMRNERAAQVGDYMAEAVQLSGKDAGNYLLPESGRVLPWSILKQSGTSGGKGSGGVARYTLHYNSNGGTAYKDEIYNSGTAVPLNKAPKREGYTFTGWYADKKLSTKITSITMKENKTVYAGWEKDVQTEPLRIPDMLNGDRHIAYISGYTNGTVRPGEHITRAEVAAIFYRLLKENVRIKNETTHSAFSDVPENMWCCTPVSTIARLGIVTGRSPELFDPMAPITRAEFATICARFDQSGMQASIHFQDIDTCWARSYIERAAALGWISGYSDGTFRPNNLLTRAETMCIINRMLGRLPERASDMVPSMRTWPDNADTNAWYYLDVQEATNSHSFQRKGDGIHETWTGLIK